VFELVLEGQPQRVYCEFDLTEAGWTLLTVSRDEDEEALIGTGFCQNPSGSVACKGHLPAEAAVPGRELLFLDSAAGDWVVLAGWSDAGGLQRFSGQVAVPRDAGCEAGCDSPLDPELFVRATSGFATQFGSLQQWWRFGGLWIGSGTRAGDPCGAVLAAGYEVAQGIWSRSDRLGCGAQVSRGHLAIYWR
jgi:hypothetical protein